MSSFYKKVQQGDVRAGMFCRMRTLRIFAAVFPTYPLTYLLTSPLTSPINSGLPLSICPGLSATDGKRQRGTGSVQIANPIRPRGLDTS